MTALLARDVIYDWWMVPKALEVNGQLIVGGITSGGKVTAVLKT